MITDRKTTLKPILESYQGVHLTAYLVNRGDLIDLKSQLRDVINEAEEYLEHVFSEEERKKFIEPLLALTSDSRIFKSIKDNVAIFRTKDFFRLISIPIAVTKQCHVANSFHVKPLLRWMQFDKEFLFLGLCNDSAHLYFGSHSSLQKIDSILFPEILRTENTDSDYDSLKRSRQIKTVREETFVWLSEWLEQITAKRVRPKLFLAGENVQIKNLLGKLSYSPVIKTPVAEFFRDREVGYICAKIRKQLKSEAMKDVEGAFVEYYLAEEKNLTRRNLFQIAKASVRGEVRKLILADDVNIYGKLNKASGEVSIHPFDMDHEDDDLLDDLAQTVLQFGGEVVLAPKNEVPKGSPIFAILQSKGMGREKAKRPINAESELARVAL